MVQLYEYVTFGLLFLVGLIILYFIIKELRLYHNQPRLAQVELDKDKLNLIRFDMRVRGEPYSRLSGEQLEDLRKVEDQNSSLEVDIFAKQRMVEARIQQLENQVKDRKLDRMLDRIREEEIKLR
jgi:hypothetical protein